MIVREDFGPTTPTNCVNVSSFKASTKVQRIQNFTEVKHLYKRKRPSAGKVSFA